MDNEPTQLNQGFIRQRRNLIIASLVLTFAQAADLTINQLNIFGNVVTLSKPFVIRTALWVAWGYWFIRYSQYFHDIGEKGFLNMYHARMLKLVFGVALKEIKKSGFTGWSPPVIGKHKISVADTYSFKHRSLWRYVVDLYVTAEPVEESGGNKKHLNYTGYEVNRRWTLAFAHVRAWLYVTFRTRLFSEFILPYIVGFFPVIYWLAKM